MALARRNFLKLAAIAGVGGGAFSGANASLRQATSEEVQNPFPNS